jgi:cytidylate kinase
MAILSISRKLGSLGDEIARFTAQKLGYRLVSREELHNLAQDCDDDFKQACSMYETEERSAGLLERLFYKDPSHASLFMALNFELASQGNIVILGRGTQIVLGGYPGVFRVRVVAPASLRMERLAARLKLPLQEAGEFMRRHDRQRRSMIEELFQKDLNDWSLYDMILNTASITAAQGAEIVAHALEQTCPSGTDDSSRAKFRLLATAKRVESAIKKKVATIPYYVFAVDSDQEGRVVLEGAVSDKKAKQKAEEIAGAYPGITEVINKLKTTELSF